VLERTKDAQVSILRCGKALTLREHAKAQHKLSELVAEAKKQMDLMETFYQVFSIDLMNQ
jgi:hypothetical protein